MSNEFRSLDEALFGRIRRELLSLFLFNPQRRFYLLELVSLLRTGRGGVQRELRNLVEAGVVSRERSGVKVLFGLSEGCPLESELRELLLGLVDHRSAVAEAVAEYGRQIEMAAMSDADRGMEFCSVKLLVVAEKAPEGLEKSLQRVELLCGIRVDLALLTPAEAETGLRGHPDSQWVMQPSTVLLHGSFDVLEPRGEGKARNDEPDLFSSAGISL